MGTPKKEIRQVRRFSVELRKHVVKEIESGNLTVSQACREYGIKSNKSVYEWIHKYSRYLKRGTVLIVEKESHQRKNEELESSNKDLQAALGRKQLEIDALQKLIEIASAELGVDLKKNFGDKPSI
ncbi:MAG: transposase [Flavobacteriaceae bacterium]|nr:transposase [Flavobacteriaceae bacterium]